MSISELAEVTKADSALLGIVTSRVPACNCCQLRSDPLLARTMKHLASMNIVSEKSIDVYTYTALSNALTEPKFRDGVTYW